MQLLAPARRAAFGESGFARRKDAAVVAFERFKRVYINLAGLRTGVCRRRGSGCAGPSEACVVHV